MTRQWLRYCKLTVEGGGEAIDLSELRIRFTVEQQTTQTPQYLDATITNLSETTAKKIMKEGQKVSLEAGYQDGHGLIYSGRIFHTRYGRENPTDTYLNIQAQGSDTAYNHAVVSKTLAPGSTFNDHVRVALEAFKPFGVTAGHIEDLGAVKMPGARVLFGMARDVMRNISIATGTSWFIHNDQLNVVKDKGALPGEAVVLNSRTGLVGLPTQTMDGIEARCLLNPRIRPGGLIHIDQQDVQASKFNPDWTAEVNNSMIPWVATDGFYRLWVVRHFGDTRGEPWYTEVIGTRADKAGPPPISLANKGVFGVS